MFLILKLSLMTPKYQQKEVVNKNGLAWDKAQH